MLRYKTETRPGLVALYDIRPGNGAGQFLQPREPARSQEDTENKLDDKLLLTSVHTRLRRGIRHSTAQF